MADETLDHSVRLATTNTDNDKGKIAPYLTVLPKNEIHRRWSTSGLNI